jgi:hypothetical protein
MLPGGGPPAIRPGRADPRFRANGERITVREEPKEVDQGLARSAKEGLFSVFHPVNEERLCLQTRVTSSAFSHEIDRILVLAGLRHPRAP